MIRRPPIVTRTDTLFPSTTLSQSNYASAAQSAAAACPGAIKLIKHPVAEIGLRMKPEAVIEAGILDPGGGPMSAVREQGRAEQHHVGHIGEHGAAKQAIVRQDRKSTRLNSSH